MQALPRTFFTVLAGVLLVFSRIYVIEEMEPTFGEMMSVGMQTAMFQQQGLLVHVSISL